MKEAIGNRLDRVSDTCNDVLRVSAVLGKVFSFAELVATAQQGEDIVLDALDEATGAQLIAATSGESFAFTHDKIRESRAVVPHSNRKAEPLDDPAHL